MAEAKKPSALPLPEAMAGNFQDAARWFQQLWAASVDPGAAGRASAGTLPSMMMPTLDIQELDKRLADLRSVEHWLEINLSMLRTTIQGLEMQRTAIKAWQDLGAAAAQAATAPKPGAPAAAPAMPASTPEAAAFQPALWWNALQQQFAQMAASALAQDKVPPAPGKPAPDVTAPDKATGKPAADKAAPAARPTPDAKAGNERTKSS